MKTGNGTAEFTEEQILDLLAEDDPMGMGGSDFSPMPGGDAGGGAPGAAAGGAPGADPMSGMSQECACGYVGEADSDGCCPMCGTPMGSVGEDAAETSTTTANNTMGGTTDVNNPTLTPEPPAKSSTNPPGPTAPAGGPAERRERRRNTQITEGTCSACGADCPEGSTTCPSCGAPCGPKEDAADTSSDSTANKTLGGVLEPDGSAAPGTFEARRSIAAVLGGKDPRQVVEDLLK